MSDLSRYYSMDLRDLRNTCLNKRLPGITRKSDRQQCLNALDSSKQAKSKKKPIVRRRSLTNSGSRGRQVTRSPVTVSRPRASRKRRRTEMDDADDTMNPPPRYSKRRRTSHPSTMTTPEKEHTIKKSHKSPLRNPRISQAPLPTTSVNYRATDFLQLLNDSSDEDVDIVDRKKKHHSPKQTSQIFKPSSPLAIIKASSPEETELDEDSESEPPNNASTTPNRPTSYPDEPNSESESEDDESTQSETEPSRSPPPPPNYHRDPPRHYPFEEESKSRSRSHSKPRYRKPASIPSSQVRKPRAKSKPRYTRYASQRVQSLSVPSHPPTNTLNRRNAPLQSAPIQPFAPPVRSQSYAPIHHRNNQPEPNENAPIESVSISISIRSYLRRILDGFRWIIRQILLISAVAVLVLVLYSPTVKLLQSIEYQSIAIGVLQTIRIIPTTRYCDSEGNHTSEDCKACPENADCANGYLYCKGDRRWIKGACVYDAKEIEKLQNQMETHSLALLSTLCGEYKCQSYWVYRVMWSITEENDNILLNDILTDKELCDELAKALQLDSTSHLFQNVFETFTESIKDASRKGKGLVYAKEGGYYYSTKSYKSVSCHLAVFVTHNRWFIIPSVLFGSVFGVWWLKRRRERNKRLREKQLMEERKNDVICILKRYLKDSDERWIPIAQIRAQIMGSNNNNKEWKRVERLVDKDANVQKSAQMVDGLQKLCWKLSDTALIH